MPNITRKHIQKIRGLVKQQRAWQEPTRDAVDELLDEVDLLIDERDCLCQAVHMALLNISCKALSAKSQRKIRAAARRLEGVRRALCGPDEERIRSSKPKSRARAQPAQESVRIGHLALVHSVLR